MSQWRMSRFKRKGSAPDSEPRGSIVDTGDQVQHVNAANDDDELELTDPEIIDEVSSSILINFFF